MRDAAVMIAVLKAIPPCCSVFLLVVGACAQPPLTTRTTPAAPGSMTSAAAPTPAGTSARSAPTTAASAPGVAEPAPSAAPAPESRCPPDMVDVKVACIDRYEAPNELGKPPLLMLNQAEAEAFCSGRGKRLCTEDEWVRACRGPSGWLYPYGPNYDEHACNQDKKHIPPDWTKLGRWPAPEASAEARRLNQAEPSGLRTGCGSAEGVFDLTGNVGEWVVRTHPHPEACQNEEQKSHRHVVMGCFWGKCFRAPHLPTCDYVNCAHASGFRSYEFGARCCRDRSDG